MGWFCTEVLSCCLTSLNKRAETDQDFSNFPLEIQSDGQHLSNLQKTQAKDDF